MIKVEIKEGQNGFIVNIEDTIKHNGTYVFRSIDILTMLEFIGGTILDRKVVVKER